MKSLLLAAVILFSCVAPSAAQDVPPRKRKGATFNKALNRNSPFLVTVPPIINKEPRKKIAFRVGESIELPCEASGEPDPE